MFIVLVNYKKPLEEVDKYLETHILYLKEQYAKGSFIASGRRVPRTGGVILSKIKDRELLMNILKQDPYYQNSIADYEVIEFTPSITAEGFEILK